MRFMQALEYLLHDVGTLCSWSRHCTQPRRKPTVRVADARVRWGRANGRALLSKRRSMHSDFVDPISQLTSELENFEEIASYLIPKPGDLPLVRGMDIYGGTLALNGSVGGDLLIFLDFKQRFDLEARIQDNNHNCRLDIVENLMSFKRKAVITCVVYYWNMLT